MSDASHRQPFMEHVQELRGRLIWIVAALLVGTTIGYYIKDQLLDLLVKPLGKTLYYTSPGGGFSLIIQLCLGFGIIFAVPVLIYHLIQFLAPVVPKYSLRFLVVIIVSSCLMVILGVSFAYLVSLPAALYFLNEFSNDQVQALISTDTYISFVAIYLAGFAILFQLPLVLLIINSITPLRPKKLLANTKWVVLASFIAAAIITPTPDPFNQTIMAGPVIALYMASAIPIKVVNRRRKPGITTEGTAAYEEPIAAPVTELPTPLEPQQPHAMPAPQAKAEYELDLSQLELVMQQKKLYKGREGELCLWKFKDRRNEDIIVTFLYAGRQEFVKIHHPIVHP